MKKSIGLLIIGSVLLIVGFRFDIAPAWIIGAIMVALGIVLIIPAIIRKEEVIDNWSILITVGPITP